MTVVNYGFFVVFLTAMKVALFISDVYTCIKLLAFNTWSNNVVPPYIPFRISKWLFSGCILASVVLIAWEVLNGIRIYRTRNISLTYVNNFSRGLYSLSQYNKFCVYNLISPSGAYQKVAFFTFFELKDCLRLLVTDTPRQVINGLTLWSVIVTVDHGADLGRVESFSGLIAKIKTIAQTNREEAVLLSFMLFSFVIWLFFITKFAAACLCSVYVYYRIISDRSASGLKEFVCVTVSEHINHLVDKYQKKRQFTPIHQTYGHSSASLLQEDDLESGQRWKNMDKTQSNTESWELEERTDTAGFNSSTSNLLAQRVPAPFAPRLISNPSVTSLPTLNDVDPVQAVSPIAENSHQTIPQKRIGFDPITRSETFESSTSIHENPFAPRLVMANTLNSINTTSTVPSYYFGKDGNSESRAARRPAPPDVKPIKVNTPEQAYFGGFGTSSENLPPAKVNTPEQAYFGEFGDSNEYLPRRDSSLQTRNERIFREDYAYYAKPRESENGNERR